MLNSKPPPGFWTGLVPWYLLRKMIQRHGECQRTKRLFKVTLSDNYLASRGTVYGGAQEMLTNDCNGKEAWITPCESLMVICIDVILCYSSKNVSHLGVGLLNMKLFRIHYMAERDKRIHWKECCTCNLKTQILPLFRLLCYLSFLNINFLVRK